MMAKYIFVTGGVVSSVGKGIVSASVGRLLKSYQISVTAQKIDPYLNVDQSDERVQRDRRPDIQCRHNEGKAR